MSGSEQRLWDKGGELDATVHRFTVGDDPYWDLQIVYDDCVASAAHGRTLHRAGLLTDGALRALIEGLGEIVRLHAAGEFRISTELEDCHTAIEAFLTTWCARAGSKVELRSTGLGEAAGEAELRTTGVAEAGRKIHTGRSRNDQVATAMRLYMRRTAAAMMRALTEFVDAVLKRIERDGGVEMPGYTHLQPAMPSSVGQWLHAVAEAALEQMRAGFDLLERLDCCPLGTGAGFGVPLPLDREYTARLLGFSRVQRSPIDVQNSRGRMETYFVRVAADIGRFLEKLAWDCVLFSSAEFGLISLPESLTTGSSIMPQKRNPDVAELMRAVAVRLRARVYELEVVSGKLPSSYHRDLQLTKEPVFRAAAECRDLLTVGTRLVESFVLNRERLAAVMRPELYATHAALELVRKGVPFRDAYVQTAKALKEGTFEPPRAAAAMVCEDVVRQLWRELHEAAAVADQKARRYSAVDEALLSTNNIE